MKFAIGILPIVFFLHFASSRLHENCPKGYVAYKKQACFMFKHTIDTSYSAIESEQICRNTSHNQGTLATIDDEKQDNWLIDLFMHDGSIQYSVWIGLIQDPKEPSEYIWRDGSTSTYRHWNKGKPDRFSPNENCIHIDVYAAQNGTARQTGWNDDFCEKIHDRVLGYLCRAPFNHDPAGCDDSEDGTSSSEEVNVAAAQQGSKALYTTGWVIGLLLASVIIIPLVSFLIFLSYKKLQSRAKSEISMNRLENVE